MLPTTAAAWRSFVVRCEFEDFSEGESHLLNDRVVGDGDALLVDLGVAPLVDELLDRLKVREAVGHVGLDPTEEVDGGAVELHEHAVVDLAQTQQLQDLLHLL